MPDLIHRRSDANGSSLYQESVLYRDRVIDVIDSGVGWPYVERRRGPRRREDIERGQPERRQAERESVDASAPGSIPLALPAIQRSAGRHLRGYRTAVLIIDAVAAATGAICAYLLRFGLTARGTDAMYFWGVAVLPGLWLAGVALSRAYESRFLASSAEEFRRVLNAGIGMIAVISVLSYGLKAEFARGYVVIALPLCVVMSMVGRVFAHRVLRRARLRGQCAQQVLVAGHEWSVLDLVAQLRRHPDAGLNIVGACLPRGRGSRRMTEAGIPVVGDLNNVAAVVNQLKVDVLAVTTCVEFGGPELRQVCWALENIDVDIVVAPSLIEVAGPRLHIRPVAGLPLLHVEKPEFTGVRRMMKAAFDRIVAALALIVCAPLMIAVAVAVRLTSPGPAFFKQVRIGARGVPFVMVKFRSMHVDAEARLAAVRDLNEQSDGLLFKIRDDPRMTRVGRLLRRCSIDELPQLINVVKGDMSLVGPRPPLPGEVELYPDDVRRRLLVKPGITGLWQVSGRSDLSWEESVRLDLRYVENWSLFYDFAILWQTAFAVLRGSGAY